MSAPFPYTPPDSLSSSGVLISRSDSLSGLLAVGDKSSTPVERLNGQISVNDEVGKCNKFGNKTVLPQPGIDPLLLAAVLADGPHLTRTHAHHPHNYVSRQAARSTRFTEFLRRTVAGGTDNDSDTEGQSTPELTVHSSRSPSASPASSPALTSVSSDDEGITSSVPDLILSPADPTPDCKTLSLSNALAQVAPLAKTGHGFDLRCMARARIPTPHVEVFLHLYQNASDDKEHLAVVIDPAQLGDFSAPFSGKVQGYDEANQDDEQAETVIFKDMETGLPALLSEAELTALRKALRPIRSASLETEWRSGETALERVARGAYVGRVSPQGGFASVAQTGGQLEFSSEDALGDKSIIVEAPPPLVRIHSECFTGETIGSMRCDCGEQLDESIRRIAEPIRVRITTIVEKKAISREILAPGRGAVIYLRQEGRGIGLLAKLRAYNLQDLGADTVLANELLGFGHDQRTYDVASAMLKDLGLGEGEGVKILTNNPDKVHALEDAGVRVCGREEMVPRAWRCQNEAVFVGQHDHSNQQLEAPISIASATRTSATVSLDKQEEYIRPAGATLIGGGAAHGPELEKYLRTKVLRMGHMLSLPSI